MKQGLPSRKAVVIAFMILVSMLVCVLAQAETVWPEAGSQIGQDGELQVDYSHAEDGYILIKGPETTSGLRARVYCGEDYVTYTMDGSGEAQVFPLTLGSGTYRVNLYREVSKKNYSNAGQCSFKVTLKSESAPYLCPNRYVWYTEDCEAVKKSMELCGGLSTDKEKVDAIVQFMRTSFMYDYVRSLTQKTDYVGDVEMLFSTRMGLCQDLACTLACMLRVQGIPTQMVVGEMTSTMGKVYHAWNQVLVDGNYVLVDITAELMQTQQAEYAPKSSY